MSRIRSPVLANRVLAKIANRVVAVFRCVAEEASGATRCGANRRSAGAGRAHGFARLGLDRRCAFWSSAAASARRRSTKWCPRRGLDRGKRAAGGASGRCKASGQLEKELRSSRWRANCVAFIDDMAGAYEWADLVICRSGALTVAELAPPGVASILVPFPHRRRRPPDGQRQIFRLTSAGGAVLLPQNEMTPESVSLIRNYTRASLLQMAEKAPALAKPEAAAEVARPPVRGDPVK